MADDNRFRSTRSGDAYRRGGNTPFSGERASGSDPLSELARLIGKNDPYAEFGLSASEEQAESPSAAASQDDEGRHASYERQGEQRYHRSYPGTAATDPQESYGANQDGYAEDVHSTAQIPAVEAWPSHHDAGYREPPFEDDPGVYAAANAPQREQASYEDEQRLEDDADIDAHADQIYDDPPRAYHRSGLITALTLVGCALLGTAGAYGYRSYYSQPAATQPPPVITADNSAPTKIVPAPAGDAQSSKVIQDRLANAGREQIVSKQEEPVAVKDLGTQAAPRVVLPAPVAPAPTAAQQGPGASGAGGSNEPRKVRTVTIRPDGGDASTKPQSPSARTSSGPLSLDPQTKEPSSPAPARTRSATAPAAPHPAAEPAGSRSGFVVQLSSQKSEAEAAASFRSLQAKFPSELGRRTPVIQRADLGSKGVFYRTMVGPFASMQEATQFCATYKAAGGHCVVPTN